MVPLVHPSPHLERHIDRFSRFSTARGCVQQTDTQTDHATSAAIGRILCYAQWRSKALRGPGFNSNLGALSCFVPKD